jgi:predicted Rossmann fold nucleotide-binding protein DprA/Smf involved in DNA uptake
MKQNNGFAEIFNRTGRNVEMIKVKNQLQAIAKNLATLSKKVESLSNQLAKTAPAKKTKAAPKKTKKVKKAVPAKKAKAKAVKKPAAKKVKKVKKVKVDKGATVLSAVSSVINKSKKGISIAQLKEKTNLDPRQLSNALYKLTKKGVIKSMSRGIYTKA